MSTTTRLPIPLLLTVIALLATACGGEPAQDATDAPDATESSAAASDAASMDEATDAGSAEGMDAGLLDPDEATEDELLAVNGLTTPAVEALIAGRPYDDMVAVDAVLAEHLDEGEREAVYSAVWKPLDLNAASREEILLVPGVGERMAHEFEEYRPYRAMAEFHREIGKYVDEDEVQRLARYVEIR